MALGLWINILIGIIAFITTTAIGFVLGVGMFAALAFIPTFLQMSSGASAAVSGLLTLPMVGLMATFIGSGITITRTGNTVSTRSRAPHRWRCPDGPDDPRRPTPIWLICVYLLIFGIGLGLIMQVVVLVAQNAVPANQIGAAT
ncbi:hypothetical protein [Corynebacterium halotolerans]|uniref:hypothetical protein n=1 Tax=Corynebacterium halotolerans TaxID=225326 RepID=UPI003CF56F57